MRLDVISRPSPCLPKPLELDKTGTQNARRCLASALPRFAAARPARCPGSSVQLIRGAIDRRLSQRDEMSIKSSFDHPLVLDKLSAHRSPYLALQRCSIRALPAPAFEGAGPRLACLTHLYSFFNNFGGADTTRKLKSCVADTV